MNTPVLFLIFNRPETTKKVFEAIRKARPEKLFIAADGPRENKIGENELCNEARTIVTQIDWPCEVKTLFRENNLGCKIGVSSAITWFFEHVENGIILEDDCLPDMSFFRFCEELLEYYKDDERIMHISGDNFQFEKKRGDGDYYFSKINHVWGWATWRRAWKYYDVSLNSLDKFIENNYIRDIFSDEKISKKWLNLFIKTKKGKIDTWDYQWTYSMWTQNGLAILPNVNLVKNIGFGNTATHTKSSNSKLERNDTVALSINKHPTMIVRDLEADEYFYKATRQNIATRFINKLKQYI
jgi:hypothetical protein